MAEIKVVVGPKGDTKVEANGFKGATCQEATRSIIESLGIAEDEQKKPEFYETVSEDDHVEAGQ